MRQQLIDIWFGPGAVHGVFGAGVALGLQEAIDGGGMDVSAVQLFGSSVGCLNALFLATGNAACGLDIFTEDTRELIMKRHLIPSVGARVLNRLAGSVRRGGALVPVPGVLNVAHVFKVLACRTPDIQDQIRHSPMPVFAETVHPSGQIKHVDLRMAPDPLAEVRSSLNAYPFTNLGTIESLDSAIVGYGFAELLRTSQRPLVIVLNTPPGQNATETLSDIACAALCGHRAIARMYLHRQRDRSAALKMARQRSGDTLLVTPPVRIGRRRTMDLQRVHHAGHKAAEEILQFVMHRPHG